ncbi:MAG TPA: FecR family protein [Gallionellaceae bacterium]|nr:FecR family protein [Gallionellaceae bacterium]
MLRIVAMLLFVCTTSFHVAHAQDAAVAGTVQQLQGAALVNRTDSSANLGKGSQLQVGDRIVTGRNARIVLRMIDGSTLTLGENTEFAINEYRYSARAKQGSAHFELIKGVFRAITGAIGKLPARDFTVSTTNATIGIRGTDFWGGFLFSNGLDVALLGGGGVYIENAAGRVEISRVGYGTTVMAAGQAPSAPIRWGDKKLAAAMQSVTLRQD